MENLNASLKFLDIDCRKIVSIFISKVLNKNVGFATKSYLRIVQSNSNKKCKEN